MRRNQGFGLQLRAKVSWTCPPLLHAHPHVKVIPAVCENKVIVAPKRMSVGGRPGPRSDAESPLSSAAAAGAADSDSAAAGAANSDSETASSREASAVEAKDKRPSLWLSGSKLSLLSALCESEALELPFSSSLLERSAALAFGLRRRGGCGAASNSFYLRAQLSCASGRH